MRIQLKKVADGRPSLACVRADGSRTWGRMHHFFPIHDLTHYAVESVFGFEEAFFGLIASGWSIDAFAEPGAASRMPVEAYWAESIVGLFDLERGSGERLTADAFNDAVARNLEQAGAQPFRAVSEDELARVRTLRRALQRDWAALDTGETLEMVFPADRVQAV